MIPRSTIRFPRCATLLVAICLGNPLLGIELIRIGQIDSAKGTGTIAFDASANVILSTNDELKIQIHDFGTGTNLSLLRDVDLSASFDSPRFVSSVAADPMGRGFGVATVIPTVNDSILGKAVFFDTTTGDILSSLDVGFNPDFVTFHSDGNTILVANEAEPGAASDPSGSISVIDISSVTVRTDLANLLQSHASTWDFGAANLAEGVDLAGIRVDPANADMAHLDLEPENIAIAGTRAFVSLQENNAVATFDLTANKWTAIHNLGTIEQLVDASDRDGENGAGAAMIDDLVHGLPQPDGIVSYQANGVTYFATANEGDARADFDFADHGIEGNPLIDSAVLDSISERYTVDLAMPVDVTDDAILGRLKISPIDGDTDADGDIDQPTMFGTRSFSIWNAESGERVYDSGSGFEQITLNESPTLFNSSGIESGFDSRSDNKGAEPESIVLGKIGEQQLAFIALERTGGVMMYDVTDPNNVMFLDYLNTNLETGSVSPEGLQFISAGDSVDGHNYLVVGYDESASLEVFRISMGASRGDFDGNGVLDVADIDLLSAEVRAGTDTVSFDLDNDGSVTDADRRVWVEDIRKTYFGDSNLDGKFGSSDLVALFQLGEYEDGIDGNSTWSSGDWNGDTEFDTSDLVMAFQADGYEKGPRADALATVPEPRSVMTMFWAVGLLTLSSLAKRRRQ